MNVLEKILEEIEEYLFDKYCIESDGKIEEIIRSHMDEVVNMPGKRLIDANALDDEVMKFFLTITGNPKQTTVVRECKESFRRMIDEQPTIYADDGWIPVSERLPNEREFQEAYRRNHYAAEFLVTIKGATRPTTLYFKNNSWFDEERNYYEVTAWQPLPEAYKGERIMDTQKAIEYFSGKLERTLSNQRRKAYEAALEALEKQEAKAVSEICGAFGETVECPECGTGLNDEDVFAGYCKWCGQRIKREE